MSRAGMSQTFVVDRIEDGAQVVLEPIEDSRAPAQEEDHGPLLDSAQWSGALVLPLAWLPSGIREGDVMVATVLEDGGVRFALRADATEARREALARRRRELPRGPEGDLSL
jgi:hypothetical protein